MYDIVYKQLNSHGLLSCAWGSAIINVCFMCTSHQYPGFIVEFFSSFLLLPHKKYLQVPLKHTRYLQDKEPSINITHFISFSFFIGPTISYPYYPVG